MAIHDEETHLIWIQRFILGLGGFGSFLWLFRSLEGSLVFLICGLLSLLFWLAHRFMVHRLLTPSVRQRWIYGVLILLKLGLLGLAVRGIMKRFPAEVLPFATGITLFIQGILLEAGRLVFRAGHMDPKEPG